MENKERGGLRGLQGDSSDEIRSIGSWSFNQNLLYVIFLQKNKLIMVSKKKRRDFRIFDRMAQFVCTRNSLQCRSHHQKLIQKFGEVKNVISNFKKYISKEEYRNKFQQLFGTNEAKQETLLILPSVKEQALSGEALQQPIKVQDNAPAIIKPEMEELRNFYNQYFVQLARQSIQYPILSFCYPSLQNLS